MLTRCLFLVSLAFLLTACTVAPSVKAQPVTDGQLTFAVIGDYGVDSTAEGDVADLVKSWNVDFVATVGDNNYSEGSAKTIDRNIGSYYSSFIAAYAGSFGDGSATPRFYPTLGNHDWESMVCNEVCSGPYLDYFSLPSNERYYDVQIGNVQLFFLDSDPREPDGITSDSTQAQWLKEKLNVSQAAHKIVLLHHPPYSSGLVHGSDTTLQWPFESWGATAVIAGHDHSYERLQIGSIPMFVNGLAGAKPYLFGRALPQSQGRYNDDYGAMLVVVQDGNIIFPFVNRKGELVDSFVQTIDKNPVQ
jgi:tartrate-resistant acid phosphatase type 5